MIEWFNENFVTPLCHYYTLESTITYGIILVLAAIGIFKLFQKLKLKIDRNFFYAMVLFIIYGGWTRALRDHMLGAYNGWMWCSPPIYILIFGVTISLLLVSLGIEKKFKVPYHKSMIVFGSILLVYNLYFTRITNWLAVSIILSLMIVWFMIFFGIHKVLPKKLSLQNTIIVLAHLFDASSTFTALTFFNYYEQHVLPSFLISLTGPWIMFPLKIVVVLGVLYIIDKNTDSKDLKKLLKIIIFILGAALGIRDFLTLAML